MASIYEVDEAAFLELYGEGLGNREIARRMDVPHWRIGKEIKARGLVSNVARGKPPKRVGENAYECNKCGAVLKLDEFPWVKGRADGRRLSYCRPCRAKQSRADLGKDPERYWRDKWHRTKRNSRGLACDLPEGYLYDLWLRQGGKCFYTDVAMQNVYGEGVKPDCPSVDRIDPHLGYVVGNVVLCTNRVNAIKRDVTLGELKQWMPGWYARLVDAGLIEDF